MGVRPADYPPPVLPDEFIAEPMAEEDERIDVGVLFVGAGPAGLAGAIRMAQLVEAHPELAEQLGEVPIAVLDKGRTPGAHQLSGAVVNPSTLRALLPDHSLEDLGSLGEVRKESVYVMTRRNALRIPTPPPFHNKGNHIFSLSQLTRRLTDIAEEMGIMILPESDAQKLLVHGGAVRGVVTGDKGLGREGEHLGTYEPGAELHAQATVLSEGTQGHLTGALMDHFNLRPDSAQVYALGVKEVWKVAHPLDRIIHTMGWPLRTGAKWREFGGSFIYPMGPDTVCIGLVVGLDHTDASLSVHDLLQDFKAHPKIRRILAGGERLSWGAKTIPEGGIFAWPKSLSVPGALITGDAAGMVNVPRLKGVHYAMRSGMLAAESIASRMIDGADLATPGVLSEYDERVRLSDITSDLHQVRNMRQVFHKGFFVGGALAGMMDATKGVIPGAPWRNRPDAEQPMIDGEREYGERDGSLTFDKLSSVFLSGNRTRDDQPNHIRIMENVPRVVAQTWVSMCPAAVYEIEEITAEPARELVGAAVGGANANGASSESRAAADDPHLRKGGPLQRLAPENDLVRVKMAPSNCVHCGAITAKGGRLTPAEGGSGPEYQNM